MLKNLNEFKKARINLTIWYALTGIISSLLLSIFIYQGISVASEKALQMQYERLTIENRLGIKPQVQKQPHSPMIDVETLIEIKENVLNSLLIFNLGVLMLSTVGGYFLSGKTLEPIEISLKKHKQFMSDAGHELKTPITALKTEIEVTLRDKNLNLSKSREVIESNLEEVNKLTKLTQQILTSSKLEEIETLNFTYNDIALITNNAIKKVTSLAKNKRIVIHKNLISKKIKCNSEKITELLVIIFDNAIKYSAENKSINITITEYKNNTKIIVKDYGIGIAEKDLPFIFDRFYRSNKARTTSSDNSFGLGLSIAKQIVSLHQGKIDVESTLGSGTTFTIIL